MIKKLKSFMKKSAAILLLMVTLSTMLQNASIIENISASVCSQEIPEIDTYDTYN